MKQKNEVQGAWLAPSNRAMVKVNFLLLNVGLVFFFSSNSNQVDSCYIHLNVNVESWQNFQIVSKMNRIQRTFIHYFKNSKIIPFNRVL